MNSLSRRSDRQTFRHVRVKFCGITSAVDADAAQSVGCDAIGLVFVPASARHVTLEQARHICRAVSPWISVVALFSDPAPEQVEAVLKSVPVHALQFHGHESPSFCGQWQRPWIKAIPMRERIDPASYAKTYHLASGWLLDCYGKKHAGGSGKSFDWSLFPADNDPRWILAGGLNAGNVARAVRTTGAVNVDVSSGIESAPGTKSIQKMRSFMQQIRSL